MDAAIKVEHLKKYYGSVKAVDDISFEVEEGELFGFLGVNGAGKSTTINMLSTLSGPTGGTASVAGYQLGRHNEQIKKNIGIVYQDNCLDQLLTVKENLIIRGSLYEKDKRKLKNSLDHVSEVLELKDVLHRPFGKLSGGQKRRSEIARALMNSPRILFLDEPTTGLDPATRKNVWKSISSLRKELNMTVFLTTHYMEEAAKATHIAIMDQGRLVQYGTPFSLKEEFAGDKLNLVPADLGMVKRELERMNLSYREKEEFLTVKISNTMEAVPIINDLKDYIRGFEVIQGNMDDVFLNVTGREVIQNA